MRQIKLILSILIIASTAPGLNAQNAKLDSLINLLEKHKSEDTTRVNLLNDIAFSFIRIDPKKSLSYAKEALELAEKLTFIKGKAQGLNTIGVYYYKKSDYPAALDYYQKSSKLFEGL